MAMDILPEGLPGCKELGHVNLRVFARTLRPNRFALTESVLRRGRISACLGEQRIS